MSEPAAMGVDTDTVGICANCPYPEPHRHGFACEKDCTCERLGAVTRLMMPDTSPTCEWGDCGRASVLERFNAPGIQWLAVCSWHAGWDDYPEDGREMSEAERRLVTYMMLGRAITPKGPR